jgi:hypothetical protein
MRDLRHLTGQAINITVLWSMTPGGSRSLRRFREMRCPEDGCGMSLLNFKSTAKLKPELDIITQKTVAFK